MLVSLVEMKSYLGIDSSDTTYDSFLTLQLEVVSDSIEGYCGRKFEVKNWTQTIYSSDLLNTDKVFLYQYPLTQNVTSVTKEDGTPIDLADIVHVHSCGLIRRLAEESGAFASMFYDTNKIEVKYESGFTVIPSQIRQVVYSLVSESYSKKKVGIDVNFGSDVQRMSIPGVVSIDFDYTLNVNERKSKYGMILGNWANVLDQFRSERTVGAGTLGYIVEDVPVIP